MGKLLSFTGATTTGPVTVEKVTTAAAQACDEVLILGFDREGELYCAASTGDKATLVYLMEWFKAKLLAGEYD
jgi:hypothetical protein